MTDDVIEKENEDNGDGSDAVEAAVRDTTTRRPAGVVFLGILTLVAIAASAYAVYKSLQMENELEAYRSTGEQIENLRSSLNEIRSINERLNRSQAEVRENQDAILARLAAIGENKTSTNIEWTLAEIEHLLIIAGQQLVLDHDVSVALAAMQTADDRLRNLDDTRLLPVRRQLTADMNALRSVRPVDIPGLALYLADITSRVETLPLKLIQEAGDNGEDADDAGDMEDTSEKSLLSKFGNEIKETLKELVRIYPEGEGAVISLLPEQRYYLYQNLRLQFEIARLAVMRRETGNFLSSVEIIRGWLQKYFDTDDESIINIQDSLTSMSKLELQPELPDITSSLETVRSLIREINDNDRTAGEPGGNDIR